MIPIGYEITRVQDFRPYQGNDYKKPTIDIPESLQSVFPDMTLRLSFIFASDKPENANGPKVGVSLVPRNGSSATRQFVEALDLTLPDGRTVPQKEDKENIIAVVQPELEGILRDYARRA